MEQIKVCLNYNIHYMYNIYIIHLHFTLYIFTTLGKSKCVQITIFIIFRYCLLKKILQRQPSWEFMGPIKVFPTYNIYYIDNIYNRKINSSNMTILRIYRERQNYSTSFLFFVCFVFSCIFFVCFASVLLFCFIFILHFFILFYIYLTFFALYLSYIFLFYIYLTFLFYIYLIFFILF